MRYEKLQVGTIKDFKSLCELLEVPVSDGSSRKALLKELERYCQYEKEGRRFHIVKVYTKPFPKEGRKDKWVTDISVILLNHLAAEYNNTGNLNFYVAKPDLYTILGLDNGSIMNVDTYRRQQPMLDIPIWVIEHFLTNSYQLKSSIVTSVLRTLAARHLISYSISYLVKIKGERRRVATEDEFKTIENCFSRELLVFTRAGIIQKGLESEVWLKRKNERYYSRVHKKVLRNIEGLESYVRVLNIGFHKDIAANASCFKRIHQANDAINRINNLSVEHHKEFYRKKCGRAREKVEQFENGEAEPRENGDFNITLAKIGQEDIVKLSCCYLTRRVYIDEDSEA
jgi:hypothetical protein